MGRRRRDPLTLDQQLSAQLPLMPYELADRGLCASHPEPELWSSRYIADRQLAVSVCESCPVLALCGEWAQSLPRKFRVGMVYAGQVDVVPLDYHAQAG